MLSYIATVYVLILCFLHSHPLKLTSTQIDKTKLSLLKLNEDRNSKLIIQEAPTEPDSHGWSKCEKCSLKDLNLLYFDTLNSSSVDLSWSLWGEFFHSQNNDMLFGNKHLNNVELLQQISTGIPVYILPMITFHIGHILVDFLEQVYFNMLDTYGQVRKDALLVIDVSGKEERYILQDKLDINSFDCSTHTFGCVMRNSLTNAPFLSFNNLNNAILQMTRELNSDKNIHLIFDHIHIGLDNTRSFHQLGYTLHPCVMNFFIGNNDIAEMSQLYRHFGEYITSFAHDLMNVSSSGGNTAPRNNFTERVQKCDSLIDVEVSVVTLEDLSFEQQLLAFHHTDILVATAGTALHNLMFMRHDVTAVIIIMQAHWCPWSWMYANQAVLLEIKPFIYCASPATQEHVRYFQWSRHFWRQGPKLTKAANVTVDVNRFEALLAAARSYVTDKRASSQQTEPEPDLINNDPNAAAVGASYGVCSDRSQRVLLSGESVTRLRRSSVELYISSFSVTSSAAAPQWRVGISGEIGMVGVGGSRRAGLTSMQHMSICMQVLPVVNSVASELFSVPTWCYPIHSLNYYSELLLNVGDPLHLLHFWVQISAVGGKVRNSDAFHIIDCRLPDGGYSVLNAPRAPTEFAVIVHANCSGGAHNKKVLLVNNLHDSQCVGSHVHSFRLEQIGSHSFQRQTTDFCMSNRSFSTGDCGAFTAVIAQQLWFEHLLLEDRLPAVQRMPSPTHPFVFLHIEKTGGTTMREFIIESAEVHGLDSFVPCHGGVHCVTLELPAAVDSLGNVSIVAGHFFWGVWTSLPPCNSAPVNESFLVNAELSSGLVSSCQPSRLVIGRHPVERAISYYYQRCYQLSTCIGYQRRINELSVAELEFIAIHERQAAFAEDNSTLVILDEGMSNAACRSLAGAKATSGLHFTADSGIPLPLPLSDEERIRAMTHIQLCVVGILERWESTLFIISEWFPWLNLNTDRKRRKMFLYSGKESREDIRPELGELLERLNDCDMILYSEMERLFELQLSKLTARSQFYQ